MDSTAVIFIGNVAHCNSNGNLELFSGHLAVQHGKIVSVGKSKNLEEISHTLNLVDYIVQNTTSSQIIIPGLVDCHLHAPQFPNLGLGLDKPLPEWLTTYTFPLEKLFVDTEFATEVYETVVKRTLKSGTTTASYYGSLHLESSLVLGKIVAKLGQRALIGKVSMNIPNEHNYYNDMKKELSDTETFILGINKLENDLIIPVVTPRFALSCDAITMKLLADLARKYDCRIQTHVSENKDEVAAVLNLYPDEKTYCEVYDKAGLLTTTSYVAHAIHLEESEKDLLKKRGVSVVHCPASNTRLISGMCPVRTLLKKGLTVGLGTDVSGGDCPSIIDAMRRCMDVSIQLAITSQPHNDTLCILWKEALYLATLGGAKALSLDDRTGNFEVGKDFDALLIDLYSPSSPIDFYKLPAYTSTHTGSTEEEKITAMLQKFIYLGNDANIIKVFVKGREISL